MLTALALFPASVALAVPPVPDFSTVTFTPNGCSAGQLNDPTNDVQQHDARNIKGTAQEPALAMGEDSNFVYLRMRVEGDPRGNGACTTNSYMANSAGWAWLISADGTWNPDANKGYEGMVIISKSSNNIQVYGNDANILDNPSDQPNNVNYANGGAGYSLCTHLRVTSDATSYIIDVAVLKSEFISAINEGLPVGHKLSSPMRGAFTMWGGTTSNGTTISVDLTCTASDPGSAKLSTTAGPGITFGTYAKITSPVTGTTQGSTFTVSGTGQASTATNTVGMSVVFKSGATTKCTKTTSISTGGTWSVSSSGCGLANGETITIDATATNSALTPAVTYTDSISVGIAVDTDGDGTADVSDNCPNVANASQADGDSDGIGDVCDNCASTANASQTDTDSDGIGDACDNCASTANASQTNVDGDAYGAACDCNDSNSAIRPNATEVTGDGVDQNCDGQELCYLDADSDGYRPNSSSTVASSDSDCSDSGEALSTAPTTDCNDASAAVRPGLSDAVCNGVDNDCDGATDEDYVSASCATGQAGICAAGTQQCSVGVVSCVRTLTPSLDDSVCNGLDDDCSGQIDEDYAPSSCGTGLLGVCSAGTSQCAAGVSSCQQNVVASATDACDGLDNDCDGSTDENFISASCSTGLNGVCAAGTTQCSAGVSSCVQTTAAAASDASCNGVDDDCSGQVDEDYAPHATSCGVGACAASGSSTCVAGSEGSTCSAGAPAANDATCNGVDDDCDGTADEDYASQATSCGVGACAATGTRSCVSGAVVNSCVAGTAAASDATCNGVDDDCDGSADEDYASQATSCGVGACAATGTRSCVSGSVVNSCVAGVAAASDASCDGVDDDCDGSADEDYTSQATSCGVGACAASGTRSCVSGAVVNSCVAGAAAASDASCNGVDDDCDGTADEDYAPHATSCGVGACAASGTSTCISGAEGSSCSAGSPAASDATCNGVDDDCDGTADEDYASQATSCGVGACAATGTRSCVSGAVVNSCVAGAAAASDTSCNGLDDDCDGTSDEDYAPHATSCGVGACAASGTSTCVAGSEGTTCSAGSPAASDASCDGVDDDCDGTADEDYASQATSCGVGACAATGTRSCVSGSVVNSCAAGIAAGSDASCDGVDDDCDGTADEDYASQATSCGVGACAAAGTRSCVSGAVVNSCLAGNAAANDASCDGVDDDCDGAIDEDYAPQPTSCGQGVCAATGTRSCVSGAPVDSCVAGSAAASDASCDGVDDDCDGAIDEDYAPQPTNCGVGACVANGQTTCSFGSLGDTCTSAPSAANDATCDGVDDDCDGQADEDYASAPTSCGQGACVATGTRSCVSGAPVDSCVAGPAAADDASCNGVDDDCNGVIDEDYAPQPTSCGVGACVANGQTTCVLGSVGDTCTSAPSALNDASCDGIDDDCDGQVDEDYAPHATSCGVGACAATGTSVCAAGIESSTCAALPAAAHDTSCDGVDDDCNGLADDGYVARSTQCGQGACVATGLTLCTAGAESDTCTSAATQTSDDNCNAIDDDCDGQVDEDYTPHATSCGVGVCAANGVSSCHVGVESSSCSPLSAALHDAVCNGIDDDCDGQIDEDYTQALTACGTGACAATGVRSCVSGAVQDSCATAIGSGSDASCDGVDDDCDGQIDEDYAVASTQCGTGVCGSGGVRSCVSGVVLDSCSAPSGAASDDSCNGLDDDCDGQVDEDYVPRPTSCGVGACGASGLTRCTLGVEGDTCTSAPSAAVDVSCDGVDDDCDGQIDEDYVGHATSCGMGACAATGVSVCQLGQEHDACGAGAPAAADASCDGVDDDCDGATDEDYASQGCAPSISGCDVGASLCQGGVALCQPSPSCGEDPDHDGICAGVAAHAGVCTAGPDDCPTTANPDQADLDRDGEGDACDPDLDGDGVCNPGAAAPSCQGSDNCLLVSNPAQLDADADGFGDACDDDDDGDGVCDLAPAVQGVCAAGPDRAPASASACADRDQDGCDDCARGSADPANDGADRDHDGICDAGEDTDADGVKDDVDLDDDNDGVPDALETAGRDADADFDGDGVPDRLDLDSDDDGIADLFEAGLVELDAGGDALADGPYGRNGFADAAETAVDSGRATHVLLDTDGDGTPDLHDLDSDGDGRSDLSEVDALVELDLNRDGVVDDRADVDGDGLRASADDDQRFGYPGADPRDTDRDEDTIPRAYDARDDGPGAGDSDADGALDEAECAHDWPCQDLNGDGRPEYTEGDSDGDGVQNALDLDDDNDGILDAVEDAQGDADADRDGVPNRLDLDADGDGLFDVEEARIESVDADRDGHVDGAVDALGVPRAARNAAGLYEVVDTDADGTPDFIDLDSDDDQISDEREAGTSVVRQGAVDSDGDGTPDYRDVDDDNDSIPTKIEVTAEAELDADQDGDGIPAYLDDDSDGDGAPDAEEGEVDADDDGVPDFLQRRVTTGETDRDHDGVVDTVECPSQPCRDSDTDGLPDLLDEDDDGDSVLTKDELERDDTDGDGTPNYLDADDDGDAFSTRDERPDGRDIDTDADGTPDYLDADDDGDGTPTAAEPIDADDNGVPDRLEPPEELHLSGGAACSVSSRDDGSDGIWLLALSLGLSLWLRRRRGAR